MNALLDYSLLGNLPRRLSIVQAGLLLLHIIAPSYRERDQVVM